MIQQGYGKQRRNSAVSMVNRLRVARCFGRPVGWMLGVLMVLAAVTLAHASPDSIRLNQIGFAVHGPKTAVVIAPQTWNFSIKNPFNAEVYYRGELSGSRLWDMSGEQCKVADFTDFVQPGTYVLYVEGSGSSYPFEITDTCFEQVTQGLVRAFYYQRSSTALPAEFALKWSRAGGHWDTDVIVHPSAASDPEKENARGAGEVYPSSKGWYDAGDYGKYVVNAGISTYQLLLLYEQFSSYYDTITFSLPESDNALPDLLDEVKWELDWLLTMQDPADGGVYHKVTDKNFIGDLSPASADETRYFIGKGSAATFDFVAVLAMASRVYRLHLPEFADSCLSAAGYAWEWGEQYPDSTFRNPSDVATGEYGDRRMGDEYLWAGYEMFLATGDSAYFNAGNGKSRNFDVPSWPNVALLGCYSMALAGDSVAAEKVLDNARGLLHVIERHPYKTTIADDFYWGSNGVAANQGMALLVAYLLSGEIVYFEGAIHACDYLLGRNATGYCYVTGYGDKPSEHPHHRPSTSDKVSAPVPGLLVGGPNDGNKGGEGCSGRYSDFPAKAYMDNNCSFTTNEVAINWNAPAAFLAGGIDAVLQSGVFELPIVNQSVSDTVPPEQPDIIISAIGHNTALLNIFAYEEAAIAAQVSRDSDFKEARIYTADQNDTARIPLDGLVPGTRYYVKTVMADKAQNIMVAIDSFTTFPSALVITSFAATDGASFTAGTTQEITFTAPDSLSAQLLFTRGGSTKWSAVPCSRNGITFTATVPASAATAHGIIYKVKIWHGADTVVTSARALAAAAAPLSCTEFTARNTYRMVSVPGMVSSTPSLSFFGEVLGDTAAWRFIAYQADKQEYAVFDSVRRATGGWLYHEKTREFSVIADCYSPGAMVALTFKKGWNCIGNPFTFPVYWSNTLVQVSDELLGIADDPSGVVLREQVFFYADTTPDKINNGTYRSNRDLLSHEYNDSMQLEPWHAYWVYAEQEGTCYLDPDVVIRTTLAFSKKRSELQRAWWYNLTIASADLQVGPVLFGRATAAEDGYDRHDTPQPPAPSTALKGAFVRNDGNGTSVKLMEDMASFSKTGEGRWELVVSSSTAAPVILSWEQHGECTTPVVLFDEQSGITVDMQHSSSCTLPPVTGGCRTIALLQGAAAGGRVDVPTQWSFSFRPGIGYHFNYTVPYLDNGSCDVEVSIYDIRGRLVFSTPVHNAAPGRYSMYWNGNATRGSAVANGYYVARLHGKTYSNCIGFQVVQ